MFALPFMVLMVCYGLMVRKLLEPGWGSGREGLTAQRTKQKSVKMIIIVLAAFMLCFLPFHLTRSLYYSLRYLRQVDPTQVKADTIFLNKLSLYLWNLGVRHSNVLLRSAAVYWSPPAWPTRWPGLWPASTAAWTPSFISWQVKEPAAVSSGRTDRLHPNQLWEQMSQPKSESKAKNVEKKTCYWKWLPWRFLKLSVFSFGTTERWKPGWTQRNS